LASGKNQQITNTDVIKKNYVARIIFSASATLMVAPLFHANLLNSSPAANVLTLRGPSSEAAPYPTDEQPGPAIMYMHMYNINVYVFFEKCNASPSSKGNV
jgi:hypothetical protein